MTETDKKDIHLDSILKEMTEAGLFFGHRSSATHPKMKKYISGIKNNVHIIDLNKTSEELEKSLDFVGKSMREGKNMLLVGTKIQTKKMVEEFGRETGVSFISERWLGGTFTNFETIRKRIAHFKELEKKKASGLLEKYTKKERAKIDKEINDLEKKFGGIKNMEKLPEVIFVLDMRKDSLAIKEAKMKGIAVIAVADTNVDPDKADYIIPANDDAISSIRYILGKLKEAVVKNKPKAENKE